MIATIIQALFASLVGRLFAAVKTTKTLNCVMASSVTVNIHLYNEIFLSSLVILSLLQLYTNIPILLLYIIEIWCIRRIFPRLNLRY